MNGREIRRRGASPASANIKVIQLRSADLHHDLEDDFAFLAWRQTRDYQIHQTWPYRCILVPTEKLCEAKEFWEKEVYRALRGRRTVITNGDRRKK